MLNVTVHVVDDVVGVDRVTLVLVSPSGGVVLSYPFTTSVINGNIHY
jgi:hypothetical protein